MVSAALPSGKDISVLEASVIYPYSSEAALRRANDDEGFFCYNDHRKTGLRAD